MAINLNEEQIHKHIDKALYYYDLPGLGIGLSLGPGESGSFRFVAGCQDAIDNKPLKTDHVFHMASVTKLLVGTSMLQLWERKMIDFSERLIYYLPEFKMADERYKSITIEQMLSHTSGMPDVEDYRWYDPETDDSALSRYVYSDEVKSSRLLFAPGEGNFAYSNIAYEVLGLIISEISGLSFEEYVEKNIFVPLGMDESDLLSFRRNKNSLCTPHEKDKENRLRRVAHFPYNRAHGPSSTLTSTLQDMNIFAQKYMTGKILGHEAMQKAWEEHGTVPNSGEKICLSWFKREQNNYVFYGHEGNDEGFRASYWLCPELDLSITVCANLTKAPVKRINREIFDLLLGK